MRLRSRLQRSLFVVVLFVGVFSTLLGYHLVRINIIERAQKKVRTQLNAARYVYQAEIDKMECNFSLLSQIDNPAQLQSRLGLDYLYVMNVADTAGIKSEFVMRAFHGNMSGGTRIIDSAELVSMNPELYERVSIPIVPTPKARPHSATHLTSGMAIECAVPIMDRDGVVKKVVYGGRLVNGYFDLVDRIREISSEGGLYQSKPLGTATIFQDDIRIATNVLDKDGKRAVGTLVSSAVYDKVVVKGEPWIDRAFVVTDWYLTGYEPIRGQSGKIIGVLYVGILERPYKDMMRASMIAFVGLMATGLLFGGILSVFLAGAISRPLTRIVSATRQYSQGLLDHHVETDSRVSEINELAVSFNQMADKLKEREANLKDANEKLNELNRSYLDLVGMVSHELKGILSSTVLNAHSVRDGHLGEINSNQKKALTSVTRNLEYFDATVKNFLNLSRIEKGELSLSRSEVNVNAELIEETIESYLPQAKERGITIVCKAGPEARLNIDVSLMQMAMNNLVGNAIKYGTENGEIVIATRDSGPFFEFEVYNDGRPLTNDESTRLFKKFSRLCSPEGRKVRGTGLGLFLCREIIEKHGGTVRHESRDHGNAFVFTIEKTNQTVANRNPEGS